MGLPSATKYLLFAPELDESANPKMATPTIEEEWRNIAKGMLKGELKKQNLTYEDLAKKLSDIGVQENESSIRNKVSRGTFSATFLLQSMSVLGVELVPFKPNYTFQATTPPADSR